MRELLGNDGAAVVTKYLTETRRCGKAIVHEAQTIVPDFRAHESNCDGLVDTINTRRFLQEAQDGDMVLSRVTAPLISQALRFLREGRKAVVRGRDFGGSLIKFIERMKCETVESLITHVDEWCDKETIKENAKKNTSETKLINLEDKRMCVTAFSEGLDLVSEVIAKINEVFTGKECPNCKRTYDEGVERCYNTKCKGQDFELAANGNRYPCGPKLRTPKGIMFSTVHRAKGLEADRVFILLKNAPMPHPMAKSQWQQQQELNLKYVAITRAIKHLTWVN